MWVHLRGCLHSGVAGLRRGKYVPLVGLYRDYYCLGKFHNMIVYVYVFQGEEVRYNIEGNPIIKSIFTFP